MANPNPNLIRFIQINLQHSRAATATLRRQLDVEQDTVAIIQEPWVVKSKVSGLGNTNGTIFSVNSSHEVSRTCIYVPKHMQACLLSQYCTRDLTAIQVNCGSLDRQKELVIASSYLPINSSTPPPSDEMAGLIEECRRKGKPLLMGCDSNAHHTVWGSDGINLRGRLLLEYLNSSNLEIANQGCQPTFVTARCQSVIDITLASDNIANLIQGWQVSDEVSMSDHRWIRFTLNRFSVKKREYRNPRLTDRQLYLHKLQESLGKRELYESINTAEKLEEVVQFLQNTIKEAFHSACPLKKIQGKQSTSAWWCKELCTLKSNLGKLFNKAKRTRSAGDWEIFKEHQRLYKKEIRCRQREAWRSFCSSVEGTSATSRLRKIISKDSSLQPSCIKTEAGSYTSNLLETVEELMLTHFPDCRFTSNASMPEGCLPPHLNGDWRLAEEVVDEVKVTWAVNTFSPYKSPGPDCIFPALLQWGLEQLLPILTSIFRASIALRYLPKSWKMVRVVFIPKPGRNDYTLAKSYRPISLTSFLLKTVERLSDRYIRDTALVLNPLHHLQHAYIPGKSTDSALHCVVDRIEKSLTHKMSTLGVFIDIEGAFDKASVNSIMVALRAHKIPPSLCEWIEQMLSYRVVLAEVGEAKLQCVVSKGCPQGGVLSPLLWNLVVDSLLWTLNNQGFYTIGYADDITILINGKFESVACNLMQTALKTVEDWCKEHALSVNPHKTELVLFTRKRKLRTILPKLFGTPIPLSDNVKYLGVILDKSMSWSKHIEVKTSKACIAYWQCRRAIGRTWGLSPKTILWLYTTVIRPMLCYGALVWWPRTRLDTAAMRLGHIQRMICLGVTGAMRTTPTAAIEVALQLPPLHLYVEEVAARTAIRLRSNGLWNTKGELTKHAAILREVTLLAPLLRLPVDKIPPNFNFSKSFEVWMTEEEAPPHPEIMIYTDGSKTEQGSGAGVFSSELEAELSIPLGIHATIFQAELYGIYSATSLILDNQIKGKHIRIITDSKAVLRTLGKNVHSSRLVQHCLQLLEVISERNSVHLTWTKSHAGNCGNEKADALARQAADSVVEGQPALALSYSMVKKVTREITLEKHRKAWVNLRSCCMARKLMPAPSFKRSKQLLNLSKDRLRTFIGVVTGHYYFNKHLYRLAISDSPDCRACNEDEETAEHVLCHCPAFSSIRRSIFGACEFDLIELCDVSPKDVISFTSKVSWLNK